MKLASWAQGLFELMERLPIAGHGVLDLSDRHEARVTHGMPCKLGSGLR